MRNFNRGGGSSDRRGGGFGGRDSRGGGFGRRDGSSARPEMHRATCAECGASCEVPFKPTGEKPVYCSNCFQGKENSSPRRSGSRDFGRSSSRDREMFKAVCDECGANCELPFKPSSDKPILCQTCFDKSGRSRDRKPSTNNNQLESQIKDINEKLDKILQGLSLTPAKILVEKKKVAIKPEIKKKTPIVKKTATKKVKKSKK